MTTRTLANKILLGLVAGAAAAVATRAAGQTFPAVLNAANQLAEHVLDPFGQVFLRLLFFVVIPLVFASLVTGITQLGRLQQLGPLAGRTFALFAVNMAIAVVIGLVMMNVLAPGHYLDEATRGALLERFSDNASAVVDKRASQPAMSTAVLVEMFMPRNLLGAIFGNDRGKLGDVLPLIVFAILVGAAAIQLGDERRKRVLSSMELVAELMTRIVGFALRLAPYAVPAMIYSIVVKVGVDMLITLALFVMGCTVALLLHLFGTMSIWLRVLAHTRPIAFFRSIRPVLITAFSTSSSNAALPMSLAVARNELKLSPSVSGFVLPLGATMNMSGTALFEGCVVLFVAQAFGIELSLLQQATLMVLAVISAIAVAGIPGGSLPLIAGLLISFGIPAEGIGIVLGVDRLLDMLRTTVNVGSDLVAAKVIDSRMAATA